MTDDPNTARGRSGLYGFLAAVYRSEPTAELLRAVTAPAFRDAIAATGAQFDTVGAGPRSETGELEALAVEFTRLFLGPGEHVAPYAAVYLGGEGASLMGPETTWVETFIADAGFEYRPDYHDLPDHIAVELEFMREITAGEADALEAGDRDRADTLCRIEAEFVARHMVRWVPKFCRQVRERADLPFYGAIAAVTEDFIRAEAAALKPPSG